MTLGEPGDQEGVPDPLFSPGSALERGLNTAKGRSLPSSAWEPGDWGCSLMNWLLVPVAVNEVGKTVRPHQAEKGGVYFCPACKVPVILRSGPVRVPHFAHEASEGCNQETIIHQCAKLVICQDVLDWRAGLSPVPTVKRMCRICNNIGTQALPETVQKAVMEYRLPDGLVADVAFLDGESAIAAVEIRVTHRVGAAKASRMPLPFIELDGQAVVDKPGEWVPLDDRFRPFTCGSCREDLRTFHARARRVARAQGLEPPTSFYRYAPGRCWHCRREILFFTWPGHKLHSASPPPREPAPRTIRLMFSATIESEYWANCCSYCGAIQGDFHAYAEPDGPFFALGCLKDTVEDFRDDMLKLAHHVEEVRRWGEAGRSPYRAERT